MVSSVINNFFFSIETYDGQNQHYQGTYLPLPTLSTYTILLLSVPRVLHTIFTVQQHVRTHTKKKNVYIY